MEIFALSGPSGTGKSTSALSFAYEKKIPAIIDDGLLIVNGKKVAGTSAKFEKNTITAVKRATFFYKEHAQDVRKAIKDFYISRILIIGTSKKMVDLIAERLQLGKINHYFYVEDIRSTSEIKMAQYIRKTEGKHIIPIPHKQVKQNFFKRLIQSGKDIFSAKKTKIGETTIVQPDFHRDSIHISDIVMKKIIEHACNVNKNIQSCHSIHLQLEELPAVKVHIRIKYPLKHSVLTITEQLQQQIYDCFNHYLHIELDTIDIFVEMK